MGVPNCLETVQVIKLVMKEECERDRVLLNPWDRVTAEVSRIESMRWDGAVR